MNFKMTDIKKVTFTDDDLELSDSKIGIKKLFCLFFIDVFPYAEERLREWKITTENMPLYVFKYNPVNGNFYILSYKNKYNDLPTNTLSNIFTTILDFTNLNNEQRCDLQTLFLMKMNALLERIRLFRSEKEYYNALQKLAKKPETIINGI